MGKIEYIDVRETGRLLGVSKNSVYHWVRKENPNQYRPFFPKPTVVKDEKLNRLIQVWDKAKVLKFIEEAKANPHYRFSKTKLDENRRKEKQPAELPPTAFMDFNKLMFSQRQKRMENTNV